MWQVIKVMGYREVGMILNKTFVFYFSCQCAGTTYNFKNYCILYRFYRLLVAQETPWLYTLHTQWVNKFSIFRVNFLNLCIATRGDFNTITVGQLRDWQIL